MKMAGTELLGAVNPLAVTEIEHTGQLIQPAGMQRELPIAILAPTESTGGEQLDPYQQASREAEAAETGKEDPAITQVPTRKEQIDAAKRRNTTPPESSMIHEAGRWISQRLTSALGGLSVRTA